MNSQTRRRKPGKAALPPVREREAFTRLELAAVLAVLGLVALLTLPALANQRERSTRVLCVNNLRLVGQAYQQWGTEHDGRIPWRTPWCEGGMSPFSACPGVPTPAWLTAGLYNNVWFHFIWLSNELRTPKILVCPSDAEKTPARTWDASPDGGFANGHYYQNRAVSYLTALDVFPSDPDGLVTGDRNVRFSNN